MNRVTAETVTDEQSKAFVDAVKRFKEQRADIRCPKPCKPGGCKGGKCEVYLEQLYDGLPTKYSKDGCNCWACLNTREGIINWYPLCPRCGNKRCPHQENHRFKCTSSNEPGQVGELIESEQ